MIGVISTDKRAIYVFDSNNIETQVGYEYLFRNWKYEIDFISSILEIDYLMSDDTYKYLLNANVKVFDNKIKIICDLMK